MKKTISNSSLVAEVNTNGGYIDSLKLGDKLIFFPKVMVKIGDELKVRGGMHVCAPNFSADKIFNKLPSHGFCRDRDWKIEDSNDSAIRLSLSIEGEGDYEDVLFKLSYELVEKSLFATVKIENNSSSDKIIAPAFHPYFYANHDDFVIDDIQINKDDLPNSIYSKSNSQGFRANGNHIMVKGITNVNEFVFWTDFKGDYICVEPTYNSIAFSDKNKQTYKLGPGNEFELKIEIKILD
ncbi:aldose epimerase family protein [Anaerococcus urinomassiliensis]|uniref:aldose epimerase family protein n=1 Tax=Anaerococcus urinomassiliensis TaxID=1745712 RepID=UPI00093F5B50|nr:hypothetical protein [Anaerococcus urinomassiliensis]